jgi:hypothetical protein
VLLATDVTFFQDKYRPGPGRCRRRAAGFPAPSGEPVGDEPPTVWSLDVRKNLIVLLVPAVLVGSLLAPAQAKKPKAKKPPVEFQAEGSIALSNPTDLAGVGVTRTEFERDCIVPAATQGLDGYVVELPPEVTLVDARVYVTATSPTGLGLFDMFFFDAYCSDMGERLGSDDGDPIMSAGTKYVLVTNWIGDPASFTFDATEVR